MKRAGLFLIVLVIAFSGIQHGSAQEDNVPFQLTEIATGLLRPLYVTDAHDGSGRLFIVSRGGQIKIWQDGAVLDTPFLDVYGLIATEGNEQGLLGLAFHPDYAQNGQFFIDYTDVNGDTVVARYTVSADDPNVADPASALQLLWVDQPYRNHNGGHLAFGPDGYLYIALGDGGNQGDPHNNAQNLGTLLGSILRIDVNNPDGYTVPPNNPFVNAANAQPEIWAWGLRNPWRFSFDRETGDLFIGDVGQNQWEEINFQPASSPGGENYGWSVYEGSHDYANTSTISDPVMPILEYSHDEGCSVTGGYVYRGTAIPDLQGTYLYGDYCSGVLWGARQDASGAWQNVFTLQTGRGISSFGEDEAGELYLVDFNGAVLRFDPLAGG
jgi:glucose/arabinose dehydrogenase